MYINKARSQMRDMASCSYPHQDDAGRRKTHKDIYKAAYPSEMEAKNVVKLGDISKALGNG